MPTALQTTRALKSLLLVVEQLDLRTTNICFGIGQPLALHINTEEFRRVWTGAPVTVRYIAPHTRASFLIPAAFDGFPAVMLFALFPAGKSIPGVPERTVSGTGEAVS